MQNHKISTSIIKIFNFPCDNLLYYRIFFIHLVIFRFRKQLGIHQQYTVYIYISLLNM